MPKALAVFFFVAALASPQSNMKEVVYEVDGTARYVNLTLTNKDGGKEQHRIELLASSYGNGSGPFKLKFYAKGGQSLYLSAQKVMVTTTVVRQNRTEQQVIYDGVAGSVHVLIRVNGSVLQEASSDAPYGIATAEGKLPD
jgi:hypothetical protein